MTVNPSEIIGALSYDCATSLCQSLYDILTCDIFNVEMPNVCAEYLLGVEFACPEYPSQIQDAPYICQDYFTDLPAMINHDDQVSPPIKYKDYSALCSHDCYYSYLLNADNTYLLCKEEIESLPAAITNTDDVLSSAWNLLSIVKTQMCVEDTAGDNCVDLVRSALNVSDMLSPGSDVNFAMQLLNLEPLGFITDDKLPDPVPLPFSYKCPPLLMPNCTLLVSELDCCMPNSLTLFQLVSQQALPPCFLSYVSNVCGMDLTLYCTAGSISQVALIQATLSMLNGATFDMSNSSDVTLLQTAIATPLTLNPQLVFIIDFVNASSASVIASGSYRFQIVVEAEHADWIVGNISIALHAPNYEFAVAVGLGQPMGSVDINSISSVTSYEADPFVIPEENSSNRLLWAPILLLIWAVIYD